MSAQATTTNHTAITTQKLLWTYNTIQLAWAKQAEFNGWNVCPSLLIQNEGGEDDKKIRDFFTVNLDETCFMASKSHLHVIGSAAKKKHEKNTADSNQSIAVVRLGSAAGVEGPRIYLAKGKELTVTSMTDKNFARIHKAPTGSYVKMTPNAYMTNEVWLDIAPSLCKGIRSMRGICDHPTWWVVLSYDSYGSHLQNDALEVFAADKILVMKEEGDTSQVSQAYNQMVAMSDK